MSEKLGKKVLQLRRNRQLSMDALGKLSGISKSFIREIESKPSVSPSAEKIFSLAFALNTTADYLMDDTVDSERQLDKDQSFFNDYLKLDKRGKIVIHRLINIYRKTHEG